MKAKNQTIITAEPSKQEFYIVREFEASRNLVFKAFSEADLLKQWLGPQKMKMKIDQYDNRTGGYYRFIHIDEKGDEFAFNGVVHEVYAYERIIRTFEFEGLPDKGHVSLEIATFEELPDHRTKLTIQCIFKSVADRDGMVESGMETGVVESHLRLDEVLENLLVTS
jgi:uncharacterized protein YndB with AHSA1/START domain